MKTIRFSDQHEKVIAYMRKRLCITEKDRELFDSLIDTTYIEGMSKGAELARAVKEGKITVEALEKFVEDEMGK